MEKFSAEDRSIWLGLAAHCYGQLHGRYFSSGATFKTSPDPMAATSLSPRLFFHSTFYWLRSAIFTPDIVGLHQERNWSMLTIDCAAKKVNIAFSA